MKPLIIDFAEEVNEIPIDTVSLDYNKELQLSVRRGTLTPAFDSVNMGTQTMTKAGGEQSDDDIGGKLNSLITSTRSAGNQEVTDSDDTPPEFNSVLSTKTMTLSTEGTDEDDSPKPIFHIGTMTNTRMQNEETDSDN